MSPPTFQRPARLSRLPGICMAFALSSVAYAGIDCGSESNCQLPDQSGHGPGGVVAATSDFAAGFAVADNFAIDAGGTITDLCWWGTYTDFVVPCPDGDVADNFTITFLTNNPGCPTGAPAAILAGPFAVAVTKMATGNVIPSGLGDLVEYQYTATIPGGVVVGAGECVWLEIQNDTTGGVCLWLWETAEGDGGAFQAGAPTDYDLAFCLNLPLGDTSACALPIIPQCEGAKGPCGGPNDSPGCEDACCCTLVCNADPICCIEPWDQQCANAAVNFGCATLPPCQAEANCQVFDVIDGINSTGLDIFISADDFTPLANGSVNDICWYGLFGTGQPADDFTVRYYGDANGLPGAVIAEFSQAGGTLIGLTRETIGADIGGDPIFVYSATHAGVPVEAGVCYWIEITNPNDGSTSWFWSVAQDGQGNGRSLLDGHGDPKEPPDGYFASDARETDLSFCLGLELSSPACGLELLFDTGPHRTVLFNGNASHLGWSSGMLNTTNDQQRRTVQAFTVPAVPTGGSVWNIDQVVIEGFLVDGTLNEFLNYEIFTRVALDQAPGPGDSIVQGQVGPVPHRYGLTETFAIHVDLDLQLSPGDYWLTMWSSNDSGGAESSNLAWFTNAEFGINNFCTKDAPPPAAGFTGCQPSDPNGDPPGSPMMLRARLYPDPGFGAYTLDPSVLDVFDKNQDPADLYNASFRVRGTVGGGAPPCPADLVVNGAVDVKDLLFMLGAWGPCPPKGDCPADLVVDGAVNVKDLLFLLGAWGPCPL